MPRLRRSDPAAPGIRRRRAGRGFAYRDATGRPVTDPAERQCIAALAIPPAWRDVWICPDPAGHLQAVGADEAGRRQYRYHDAWRARRDAEKFDRMLALARAMPAVRRSVTADLRRGSVERSTVLAAAVRLLDAAGRRIGSEEYVTASGSRGLTTLLCGHARVEGSTVVLRFRGKGGHAWDIAVHDPDLAPIVERLADRGRRARLLAWPDGRRWRAITPAEVNADLRRRSGVEVSAKDLRTLRGTAVAAAELARIGARAGTAGQDRAIAEAVRAAAAALENTPAIARGSYVDPRVLDLYREGRLAAVGPGRSADAAVVELLSGE
jgi:DNA topoisomerase-1